MVLEIEEFVTALTYLKQIKNKSASSNFLQNLNTVLNAAIKHWQLQKPYYI